jgi:protein SCO1/2
LEADRSRSRDWVSGQIATGKRFIPNVPVITHQGEHKLFYDDLVKDRTVIVQFMSIAHHARYPATRNLVQVQELLGSRLGDDVFMYSITADPQNDSARSLARFAGQHYARRGWLFLTGDESALLSLKNAFFVHGGGHAEHSHGKSVSHADDSRDEAGITPDCSMGLLRYGNDTTGLWGSVPTKTDAAMIVERLSWILPQTQPNRGRRTSSMRQLKRRGPFPKVAAVKG